MNKLVAALCAATLGVMLVVGWQVNDLRSNRLVLLEEIIMQSVTTTWPTGASEHAVTTPRDPGESTGAWLERHREAVEAAQAIWPPD